MRKLASLSAAGLLALAAAVLPSASATADGPECNVYDHCYGIIDYNSGNIDSVGLELWTDCLHLLTPLTDMATHEVWMFTNASPPGITWIEGGYIRGIVAGGDSQTFFRWFWAEYTGSTYYSHFIQWASVAQWNNLTFARLGTNKWGIYIGGLGGTLTGETAQTATLGTHVQVGAETTEPKVYSHGKSRYLLWHAPGLPYWSAPSSGTPLVTSGVYSVSQSSNTMEQTSLQNMCTPSPAALAKPSVKVPTDKDLKALAEKIATASGETAPTDIKVVPSTRGAAQRQIGGGKVDSDQAVQVIQMSGSFVGRAPKGAKIPRGTTMTITVDAKTGEVTDTSLGTQRTDLAKLGAVKPL